MKVVRVDCPDCAPKPTGIITVYEQGPTMVMTTTNREFIGEWKTIPTTAPYEPAKVRVTTLPCACRRCRAVGHIDGAVLDDAVCQAAAPGGPGVIRLRFHKDA